jgi:hypothetical protein
MLKSIFLVFGIATLTILSLTESKSLGDVDETKAILQKILSQVQALKYGDECSWEVEEIRQNYTQQGLLSGDTGTFRELIGKIVENGWQLCSATELFVCDKESQKCVCGDPGYESQFGMERDLYTLEGNNKCRWNTGTYCVPSEFMTSLHVPGLKVDSTCRSGTSCTARDGQACTKQEMIRYLLNNYDQKFFTNPAKIGRVLASGEICSCEQDQESQGQVDPEYATTDQHENSVYQIPSNDNTDNDDKPPTLYRIHLMGEEDEQTENTDGSSVYEIGGETEDSNRGGRGRRSPSTSDDLELGSLVRYVAGASVSPDLW